MNDNHILKLLKKYIKSNNEILDNIDKRLFLLEEVLDLRLSIDTSRTATEQSFLKNEFIKRINRFRDNISNLRSKKDKIINRRNQLLNEIRGVDKSTNDLINNAINTRKHKKYKRNNDLLNNLREV